MADFNKDETRINTPTEILKPEVTGGSDDAIVLDPEQANKLRAEIGQDPYHTPKTVGPDAIQPNSEEAKKLEKELKELAGKNDQQA